MSASPQRCPACDSALRPQLASWLARCEGCGLWASSLAPVPRERQAVDLAEWRTEALEGLRRENFDCILDLVGRQRSLAGADLLEVGCADGWFLEMAAQRGARAVGLEPDEHVARGPLERGLEIRIGRFPCDVGDDEHFDVIVFNDVFEHLPDPGHAVERCRGMLRPGGLLVLNLPDSRGLLYRSACAIARVGIDAPLRRMWQAGLESPHLFYFDADNLARLCARAGFRNIHAQALATLRVRGLWRRIRLDGAGLLASAAQWLVLACATPCLTRFAPADILLHVNEIAENE